MNRRAIFGFLGVSPIAAVGAALATDRSGAPNGGADVALMGRDTKVILAPGRDGHLWLKIEGRWQRVVTE